MTFPTDRTIPLVRTLPDLDILTLKDKTAWTPTLEFGGASVGITYSTQLGSYLKIGSLYLIEGIIILTNKGSSTGQAKIGGLPESPGAGTACCLRALNVSFADFLMAKFNSGSPNINLEEVTNAGAKTNLTDADFANNSDVRIAGLYFV